MDASGESVGGERHRASSPTVSSELTVKKDKKHWTDGNLKPLT